MCKITKLFFITAIIFTIGLNVNLTAQQNMRDVVYLKNGSIIKGIIVEQIPNVSYKIETADGSVFVYSADEVEKITKENILRNNIHTTSSKLNSRIGVTIGLAYANNAGSLNPGFSGNIFYHHSFNTSFLSVNLGLQHYSYEEGYYGISIQSVPITIGYNGTVLQENNTIVYIGIELGVLIENGHLDYYGSETNSGIVFQPVLGASIPLSKSINLDCFVKPMFTLDGYSFYYSTSFNVGISFNLNTK